MVVCIAPKPRKFFGIVLPSCLLLLFCVRCPRYNYATLASIRSATKPTRILGCGSNFSGKGGRARANVGPKLAEIVRLSSQFWPRWPRLIRYGPTDPQFSWRGRPNWGTRCLEVVQTRPIWANIGHIRPSSARKTPTFHRCRKRVRQIRPVSVRFCRIQHAILGNVAIWGGGTVTREHVFTLICCCAFFAPASCFVFCFFVAELPARTMYSSVAQRALGDRKRH